MVAFPCSLPSMARPRNEWRDAEEYLLERCEEDEKTGCWEWIAGRSGCGYGAVIFPGENRAHRAAYKAWRGPIPKGMQVRHACDNKICINPDHLLVGSCADNVRDAQDRGLNPSGEKHGMAKLNAHAVSMIRKHYSEGRFNQRELGEIFGVSQLNVSRIVRNKTWTDA